MISACSPDFRLYYNGVIRRRSEIMSTEELDSKELHLPDLVVKGFRGIEDLKISRLGRVNLISGKNGVGKTTLLDAVRAYAARGRIFALESILHSREGVVSSIEYKVTNETLGPNWTSLFHGREASSDTRISIGPTDKTLRLHIEVAPFKEEWSGMWRMELPRQFLDKEIRVVRVKFRNSEHIIPMVPLTTRVLYEFGTQLEYSLPSEVACEVLGPGLPGSAAIAQFWDRVVLTDEESRAEDALNLIYGGMVERVAMVGDGVSERTTQRRAVVKLDGEENPVPLMSLGDGAVRLFGVTLALANSKDGFLLIDEMENGIHYSLQFDFWKMVMKAAHENNVQVFATTHSWDCIRSFAYAAMETEDVEGTLVRLHHHRRNGKVRAIEYSESDLRVVAEQGIEVR